VKHSVCPIAAFALAAAALTAAPAIAQSYPAPGKPIKIVVPTAAGGGNDAMARIVAQKLNERLKWTVIVDNKAGGNGAIASEHVAKSAPDGYTILFGYIATHGINPAVSKVSYDPIKDFEPIAQVAEAQGVLIVTPSLKAKNVAELVALAKAKPGSLSYASAGNGTAPHIAGELFKQMTGTDILHVPYKGSAPAVTDTLAGTTQMMFPSLIAASGFIKSGKVRAIAVTGKKRSALYPDLPTLDETGVRGFEVVQWYGFFAPAKTPKEIVTRLNTEIVAVLRDPDVVKKMAEQGADIVTGSPDQFGKLVQSEIAKWSKLVKDAKITAD
jgi:tripartite-type tricarboxylate transporter receptor subunit TctC